MSFSASVQDHARRLGVDLQQIASPDGDAHAPDVQFDADHPLSHYYISSSHNTYLWGNQLYGRASPEAYQKVLERACRCVEIDVWDGVAPSSDSSSDEERTRRRHHPIRDRVSKWRPDRTEPRVLHGHTATKECSFRDVVETIGLYAFTRSDLPLIISLEIHTTQAQQEIMVEIMKEYWGPYLLDVNSFDPTKPLPSLEQLKNKILIKVKYSPPKAQSADKAEHDKTDGESSGEESQTASVKKGTIIPELGSLGLLTRSCHFSSFDQAEASDPTHIFSLSETKLSSVHAKDPEKLFKHNKDFMIRIFPKGVRVSSGNADPAPAWRLGAQIVALNWQYINEATMLNFAMFHGTGGYVLKPSGHRDPAHTTLEQASKTGTVDLCVEVFAGQNLGPAGKKLKAYVKCELHTEEEEEFQAKLLPADGKAKDGQYKRHTKTAEKGRDPDFKGEKLDFRGVKHVTEDLSFVRFKVMDDESFSRDDLVGWACFRLKRLREGVRFIHVYDLEGQPTDGRLLVKITKHFVPN